MKDDDKPLVNPYVLLREEFDDWAVLFDPDTGHGFGLSPTGVFVWQLLDGQHTVDAVVEEVRGHAEGVPHDVGEHVRAFVDVLITHGLAGAAIDLAASTARPGKLASPAGRGSEAKPFNYEPPNLVNLNSVQPARLRRGVRSHAKLRVAWKPCGPVLKRLVGDHLVLRERLFGR